MRGLGRLWAGKAFGTNVGNLFVEFTSPADADHLEGTLRFLDEQFGVTVYNIEGNFDGTKLTLKGKPKQSREDVVLGTIEASAQLTPAGELRGTWKSDIETGGTFVLFPHDLPATSQEASERLADRLHTATRTLGALRLYVEDLGQLIRYLKTDFTQARVVVTYHERGNEVSRFADDFMANLPSGELRYLRLNIQEPEARDINRVASVELNAGEENRVMCQGLHESWVIGKAEALASYLRTNQKVFADKFRKSGVTLGMILFCITLVLLPELSLSRRIVFLLAMLGIGWAFNKLHAKLVPNALIFLSSKQPGLLERVWPQALSWVMAFTSGLVVLLVYGLLKGEAPMSDWWTNMIH